MLLLTEAGFRLIFAIRDRLTAEPSPDRRVLAEGYGGDNLAGRSTIASSSGSRNAGSRMSTSGPKPFHGQDDRDRLRRAARHVAASAVSGDDRSQREARQDPDAGRFLALGLRRARRPDDSLARGSHASRARLARRAQEPVRDRLRQHAGTDWAHPRSSRRDTVPMS